MEWIFFAVGVAVIGIIGIALGLVLGRAVARRAARREGVESDSFMTPVGPPPSGDEGDRAGGEAAHAGDEAAHAGDVAPSAGDVAAHADGAPPDDVAAGAGARDDARD